jgi:serine/threonine protein kinase
MVIVCGKCQSNIDVPAEAAGTTGKCPKCGNVLAVPADNPPATSLVSALSSSVGEAARPRVETEPTAQVPPPGDAERPAAPSAVPKDDDPSEAVTRVSAAPPTPAPDTVPHAADSPTPPATYAYNFLAPAQSPDEMGRLGPYRVLKVLGQGGMGVVFLAQDIRLGRQVALKAMLPHVAMRPEARERFLREAQTAARIEHDHIVAIYQVDEDRGVPYIAMPLLKGTSLENWLREHKDEVLPVPLILTLGRQLARGLAAAHAVGLIHRDIKPANIFLQAGTGDSSGSFMLQPGMALPAGFRAKILDFGLARSSSGEQNLTQSGVILGTPAYMAPEQARRGARVDHRADLFSLGVVLYRLCTGQLPFKGDDMMSTLMSLATEEPTPPREINAALPPRLSGLVVRLLQKDPERRPGSAEEVVERLEALEAWLADAALRPGGLEEAAAAPIPMPVVREVPVDEAKPPRRWPKQDDFDISLPPAPPSTAMSMTSLILGICSVLLTGSVTILGVVLGLGCWCSVIGGAAGLGLGSLLAIVAIVCGLVGLRQGGKPYARAGLISAAFALVLTVAYLVLTLVFGVSLGGGPRNAPLFGPARPPPQVVPAAPVINPQVPPIAKDFRGKK